MLGDAPVYTIKRGDTAPSLRATLLQGNKAVIDLTDCSVAFHMRPARGQSAGGSVSGPARIVTAARGQVAYDWRDGDTDIQGLFRGEFEITFGDGSRQTIPSDGYIDIEVLGDLA